MFRRVLPWICLLLSAALRLQAQDYAGHDALYDFNVPALTPSPKGYVPFYISHYGRHGSRFAWQKDMYGHMKDLFDTAAVKGLLTPLGESVRERAHILYDRCHNQTGELAEKGVEQQRRIADVMAGSFPEVFRQGPAITAWSSHAQRAIMSMGAFCLEMQRLFPELEVRMNENNIYLYKVVPDDKANPFRDTPPAQKPPYSESTSEFFSRHMDYMDVFYRLFTDVKPLFPENRYWNELSYLYQYIGGMDSLDGTVRLDDVVTEEQERVMWEAFNYAVFQGYQGNKNSFWPVIRDIIELGSARVADGKAAVDLRFGHDYALGRTLCLLNVNGIDTVPEDPDNLWKTYSTDMIPMGANLQIILYRPKKAVRRHVPSAPEEVLFKLLLNGREATLPALVPVSGPYYRWSDFVTVFGK